MILDTSFVIDVFDVEHAFLAGELEAELRRAPAIQQDRINSLTGDLLIAAVTRERNATVVTENASEFELFDGVSVDTYL